MRVLYDCGEGLVRFAIWLGENWVRVSEGCVSVV